VENTTELIIINNDDKRIKNEDELH